MSRWFTTLPVIAVSAFLLLQAGSAQAYVTTTGSGSGTTQLPGIVGPSSVSVSQADTVVTVSWSAATLSGVAVQGYKVTRSDSTSICGSPTLVTSLSCTDSGPPAGTYTYTVDAVFSSWDAIATSGAFTILTAPSITAQPPSASNSTSASFSFSGGSGSSYQCQLDGGAYGACASPASYSALSQGSHTFKVRAASGASYGPATSYTWTVDTVPPTQSLAVAGGAYLNGSTLYYNGAAGGSFKLVDTVSDSGSGPASAGFPAIATAGWTHGAETVTTPAGGPYTSATFSWTPTPSNPAAYSVTGADAAGNTVSTGLGFVNDSTAPGGGAVTVNGTAASAGGSTSQATNSTSFAIGSRTDYTDGGSGLKSSVLTVQSESLSGSTCGAPGSGGPFTSLTTITGTSQPSGIVAGSCYVYTLTGTDNVGNVASVKTTVLDNALSFQVTSQPSTASAGTSTSVTLTAIKNGTTDTTYSGATLTWSGAANSPIGTAPTLPTSPAWSSGVATFAITLVDAQTATLTVSDGTRSATFTPITVSPGAASKAAWTSPSSPHGLPATCFFTCAFGAGFGNSQTFSGYVSITDSQGNVVSNVGAGKTVGLSVTGKGSVAPPSLTLPAIGAATTSLQFTYTSKASGAYNDTLTAAPSFGSITSATATFSK